MGVKNGSLYIRYRSTSVMLNVKHGPAKPIQGNEHYSGKATLKSLPDLSLILGGAQAQEGYSTCLVCVSVTLILAN